MSFITPPNFRQLPQKWEISQPFHIGGDSSSIRGPSDLPALNWAPGSDDTTLWDAQTAYNVNDAVVYNDTVWVTGYAVTGIAPLTPLVDANGNTVVDVNGNPIYPWSTVVNWNPTTLYNVNDAVMYLSHSWMATVANTGVPPGTGLLDVNGNPVVDINGNPILPWQLLPIKLGAGGGVAYDIDPVLWARNHILAILLTNQNERVMRPTYGAGLRNFVFENNDPFQEQTVVTMVQQAVALWEPNITINDMSMKPDPINLGEAQVIIHFSVGSQPTQYNITFSLGGQGIEVMS
jgi:uncharacterized protein